MDLLHDLTTPGPTEPAGSYDPSTESLRFGNEAQAKVVQVAPGAWFHSYAVQTLPGGGFPSFDTFYAQVLDGELTEVGVNPVTLDARDSASAGATTGSRQWHQAVKLRDNLAAQVFTEYLSSTYKTYVTLWDCTLPVLGGSTEPTALTTIEVRSSSTPLYLGPDVSSVLNVRDGVAVIGCYSPNGFGSGSLEHGALVLYEDWDGSTSLEFDFMTWDTLTTPHETAHTSFFGYYAAQYGQARFFPIEGSSTQVLRVTFYDTDTVGTSASDLAWVCDVAVVEIPGTLDAGATDYPLYNYPTATGQTPFTITLGTGYTYLPFRCEYLGTCVDDRYLVTYNGGFGTEAQDGLYTLRLDPDHNAGELVAFESWRDMVPIGTYPDVATIRAAGSNHPAFRSLGCFRIGFVLDVTGSSGEFDATYPCGPTDIYLLDGPNGIQFKGSGTGLGQNQAHVVLATFDPLTPAWDLQEAQWVYDNANIAWSCDGSTDAWWDATTMQWFDHSFGGEDDLWGVVYRAAADDWSTDGFNAWWVGVIGTRP